MKMEKLKTFGMFALCASLCVVGAVSLSTANADGTTEPTPIANDDGFYMSKGAQVRIPTATQEGYDGTGIRFAVNLQSAYLEQLESTYETVTFYSLIAVNGASATVPNGFTGEESTTVIDNVALLEWRAGDYGTLQDGVYTYYITPTNMQTGYDIELTVGAVAKVTDAQGEVEYLYAKANDNTRTMESVALAAYLDNKTDSKYAYLNKYYGTATEYKGSHVQEYGDSTVSFTSDITVAELSEKAYACIGATKVTLADGKVAIDSAEAYLTAGETYTVSIFDGDKVYTKDMLYITRELNQASDLSVFALTNHNVEGYYLVTADIDASEEATINHTDATVKDNAYDFDYKFTGTFDGDGHTITANVSYGGVFGVLENATVKNARFVLTVGGYNSSMDNSGLRPTGLAQTAINTTISNVYAELNAGTGLRSNRVYAISLIMRAPKLDDGYLKTKNLVVVNNDDFANIAVDSTWYTASALFYEDAGRAYSNRDEYMENVFVVAPKKFGSDNSGYVAMASGTPNSTFASNDEDSKNAVQAKMASGTKLYQFANVTRYSTVKAFVESLAWENKIPDFIMENLLVSGTSISVGNELAENNGEIALPLDSQQEVVLKIGERALTDVELSCVDGAEFVAMDGTSIALTEVGTATLTATGKFGEMPVAVTFTVTLKSTTHEGTVLFSGKDGDVDMKTIFGEGATLATAYDADGTVYTVADNKITNLTNETNAPVEKTLLLGTENNEWKYVTFKVYTKLIDEASDLKAFELKTGATQDITGCYLVITDISASADVVINHTDVQELDDGQTNYDYDHLFTGLFDGNNHTVEVNVTNGGLFGKLKYATVQNVNFIFNISGVALKSNYFPTGLATEVGGSISSDYGSTVITNVYAKLNRATGLTEASGRNWALSLIQNGSKYVRIENIVVVNNDDFTQLKTGSGWVAGALFYSDAAAAGDGGWNTAHRKNVFVIAPEQLGVEDDGTGNPSTYYGNYIPMSGGTYVQGFDKDASDEILTDAYDKAVVAATAAGKTAGKPARYNSVTRYSTVNDFVDGNAWSGIIADFMMTVVRVDYVTNSQS